MKKITAIGCVLALVSMIGFAQGPTDNWWVSGGSALVDIMTATKTKLMSIRENLLKHVDNKLGESNKTGDACDKAWFMANIQYHTHDFQTIHELEWTEGSRRWPYRDHSHGISDITGDVPPEFYTCPFPSKAWLDSLTISAQISLDGKEILIKVATRK